MFYVLGLENQKYYITQYNIVPFNDWMNKFHFVRLLEINYINSEYEILQYYINKHGINSVRSDNYHNLILSINELEEIFV